jgi:hypothetical protein
MTWKDDLKFGQQYELIALKYFDFIEYQLNDDNRYDLLLDNQIKVEVKADRLSHSTRNMAIEFECFDKPSGINTSEADYYIYFVVKPNNEYTAYKIKTEDLKKKVEGCRIVRGGDMKASKMYLLNLNAMKEFKV